MIKRHEPVHPIQQYYIFHRSTQPVYQTVYGQQSAPEEIQASLYPNSEYLTNSELFRKEFDMYFPSTNPPPQFSFFSVTQPEKL